MSESALGSSTSSPTKGVSIVTGAAQGIGKAIAIRLAQDGFDIALNDISSKEEQLKAVEKEIAKVGRRTAIVHADVSSESEVKEMVEKVVEVLGGLDVMVANAGICPVNTLTEMTADHWDAAFAVNSRGTFLCYKYAAIQMIKQGKGGRIIGASSSAGKQGRKFCMAYSATKFAVRGMTQSAAWELGKHGITVNAYAPGAIETEMGTSTKNLVVDAQAIDAKISKASWTDNPSGRWGEPEEVAALVSFIASKDSSFVTGELTPALMVVIVIGSNMIGVRSWWEIGPVSPGTSRIVGWCRAFDDFGITEAATDLREIMEAFMGARDPHPSSSETMASNSKGFRDILLDSRRVKGGRKPAAYKPETPHIHNLPQTGDCWKECLKKVDESDADRCKGWREDIDTLLVFAGLFSAVVTAFTVESYQWLDTDPEDATAEVLIHIMNHLNLGSNASLPATLSSEHLMQTMDPGTPSKPSKARFTSGYPSASTNALPESPAMGCIWDGPYVTPSARERTHSDSSLGFWTSSWKPSVPCAYKSPQAWLFYQFTDIILPSKWPGLGVGVNPFFRGLSDWFGVDISHSSYVTRDVDDSLVESAMDWMNETFGASQEMSLNIYRCLEDYSTHRSSYLPRGLRSPSDLHKYNLLTRYHGWYWWNDSTRRHLLELLLRAVNDPASSDEDITNALDRIGRVAMEFSGGMAALSLDADPEMFKNLGEGMYFISEEHLSQVRLTVQKPYIDLLLRVFSSLRKFCLQDRASPTHFLACYSILNRYWLRMKQEWPNRWPDWDQPVSFISDLDEWLSSAPKDNRYRIPRILKCVWLLNSIVLEPPIAFERSAVLRFAQMLDQRISSWGIARMLMEQLGESGGLRTMSWSDAYRNLKRMSYRGQEVDLDPRGGEDEDGDGKDVVEFDPGRVSPAASVVT
ncbi:hypothetical protein AAF712_011967 [Marasmius tenuissimus]|uniref:DUF6535 domain-containing protein n=1 Tax=Marasmius tenuissimus TaxID=585030 RepID=A0ABR2ZIL5_9AGAR